MVEPDNWKTESDGRDEHEDDVDDIQYKHAKDALLFCIEVSNSMLASPPADGKGKAQDSPLLAALKCAYELMVERIIASPHDTMGILLYGSEARKFAEENGSEQERSAFPNCYLLADLEIPSAEQIKAIKTLTEEPERLGDLIAPSKELLPMFDVLFNATDILTTRAANFASKRLFIVTDNDNPHNGVKQAKDNAIFRAKDLFDLGVVLEVFPVAKPGETFDTAKFYDDVVWKSSPTDPDAPASFSKPTATDGLSNLHSLLKSVRSKLAPKRAQFAKMPMELGPDLTISVKGYIIFKRVEKAKTASVWLGGEKVHLVKPVTTRTAEDSGRSVEKVNVHRAYKFGGTQIPFSPEELSEIRHFGDPVIRVIGFKPITSDTLPLWANCKTPHLIYPSEEGYVGSTRVFSAFLRKLKKANRMAVAWFIARSNATPTMVAILPGEENVDEDSDHSAPPGMWLIPLPFADDIRQDPPALAASAPASLAHRMGKIVTQLHLRDGAYRPERYSNPDLQNHYRILQSIALEEEQDEDVPGPDDKTLPGYKGIRKRATELISDWEQELDLQDRLWREQNRTDDSTLAKRPGTSGGDQPKKKAKTSGGGNGVDNEEMKMRFEAQTINKLTVGALKDFLSEKGLSTSGAKAALVERVETFFESKA